MRPIVSKFKVFEEKANLAYWGNVASENILIKNYPGLSTTTDISSNPIEFVSTIMNRKGATPITDYLYKTGRTIMVDSDTVTWKLRTQGKFYPKTIGKLTESETPGIQRMEFPVWLDTDQYLGGDIISPLIAPDLECRVVSEGPEGKYSKGEGWVYLVQLVSSNPDSYFPPELLEAEIAWFSGDRTAYGEASSGYGSWSLEGTGYIQFEGTLSDVGRKARVTNKAQELVLRVAPCDERGKVIKDLPSKIITKIEAEFMMANKREKEMTLFWGRSAGKGLIDRTSGFYVRRGAGIREYLEDGNEYEYPRHGFSIEMIEDYVQSMYINGMVDKEDMNVVIYSGLGGITLWKKAMQRRFAESGIPMDFNTFTSSAKSLDPKNTKGLAINTAYAIETKLFPYGSIRIEHLPSLDSKEMMGGILDPETGLPLTSFEFYLFDFGPSAGEYSNVNLLEKKSSQEVYTYLCGVWSPAGPINTKAARGSGFVASHAGRFYDLLYANTYGVVIRDITRLARFVPAVSRY